MYAGSAGMVGCLIVYMFRMADVCRVGGDGWLFNCVYVQEGGCMQDRREEVGQQLRQQQEYKHTKQTKMAVECYLPGLDYLRWKTNKCGTCSMFMTI